MTSLTQMTNVMRMGTEIRNPIKNFPDDKTLKMKQLNLKTFQFEAEKVAH